MWLVWIASISLVRGSGLTSIAVLPTQYAYQPQAGSQLTRAPPTRHHMGFGCQIAGQQVGGRPQNLPREIVIGCKKKKIVLD